MSEQPQYDGYLETGNSRTTPNQPNGVSEADKQKNEGWGHRSEMSREQEIPDKKGASSRYNERINGKAHENIERENKKCRRGDPNDGWKDRETHEKKYDSKREKFADKFGEHVSDEMKAKLAAKRRQERIEGLNEEAEEILND